MSQVSAASGNLSGFDFEDRLIGDSPAMGELKRVASSIAQRRSTVMVLGETGSGKEMLARYIHQHSDRSTKPFIPVDCSSLTDTLFESELFGHVRGAFTGAMRDSLGFIRAADTGTLFLDEIGELSLPLQAKLLRVLQEKQVIPVGATKPIPVDIRVITATNRSLEEMVAAGQFRQDLFFRLNVVVLRVPPLRMRIEDIVPLGRYFLKTQAEIYGEEPRRLAPEVCDLLQRYSWPGNVRELANVMEHAHVLANGEIIEKADLPPRLQVAATAPADGLSNEFRLEDIERAAIARALKRVNFNKAAAARLLGLNIQRLGRMMDRLGIQVPK